MVDIGHGEISVLGSAVGECPTCGKQYFLHVDVGIMDRVTLISNEEYLVSRIGDEIRNLTVEEQAELDAIDNEPDGSAPTVGAPIDKLIEREG